MFTTKKIAVVSVINDLVTDNRVNRTCRALVESGYEVLLIGRMLPGSMPIPVWPFRTNRIQMLFGKGPAFYLFFMARLFFKLLFKKANLLYANDLDTLLPNFLVSKIRRIPLIFDSHELFCEVPELAHSPIKKKLWHNLESYIIPKLNYCVTVNESIAQIFKEKYKVRFTVIKNISDVPEGFLPKSKQELGLPVHQKIILLQGAGINIDRGAEELVEAMKFVDKAILLIIGGGDSWPLLQKNVKLLGLQEKIQMISKLPKLELLHYTFNADLGISIDKNTNSNYYNSLPNKVFDYLHAGVPLLASRLPEIELIINKYKVGEFIENHDPEHIASKINTVLGSDLLGEYKKNTAKASAELTWQNEKRKLMMVIKHAGE